MSRNMIHRAVNQAILQVVRRAAVFRELTEFNANVRMTPDEKRTMLQSYASARHRVFIETGTYQGLTAASMACRYQQVLTIELHPELAASARSQLATYANVRVLQGDSADVLGHILKTLDSPAVFWLDAHYSQGKTAGSRALNPIAKEISLVLAHECKEHVLLIDDARLFVGLDGYPRLRDVRRQVAASSTYGMSVLNDVIRIAPDTEWWGAAD